LPYLEVKLSDIIFDPNVQTYCMSSNFICPSYGHSWACPPEAPFLEQPITKYNRFFLIFIKFNLETYIETQKVIHPKRSKKRLMNAFFMNYLLRDDLEQEINSFFDDVQILYKERTILWDNFVDYVPTKQIKDVHMIQGTHVDIPTRLGIQWKRLELM
jgi:hypothetical protein